jgi:hypothetical protein
MLTLLSLRDQQKVRLMMKVREEYIEYIVVDVIVIQLRECILVMIFILTITVIVLVVVIAAVPCGPI